VNKGKRKGRTPKEPDPRLTSHYLRTDRRTVVKGASQPSWVFLSAYSSFFHARCASVLNHPTMGLIHRSAWKGNSANFAQTEFSAPLCHAALREGACTSARRLLKTASEMRLLRHRSASLRDLPSDIFLR
jgi:hypothetical protein